ncbi:MAG: hypothetical protein HY034_03690 [Nitrospirae bacterium]|nr:hypothetical protein [Nitrospirota bacterium]
MKKILFFSLMLIFAISPYISAKDKGDGRPNGGALSYGEFGRPATLDPVTSNEMIAVRVVELLFNSLVGINAKQEIVPELAEKWEITPDNRTFTFYLRKDVMWHKTQGSGDDKYLTADDVIYTYNVMTHPKTITPLKLRYEFIQEIKKIDPHTVQFVLKRPVLNALAKFTLLVAKPFADQNIMSQALMFNAIDMIVLVNPRAIPEIDGDKRFILYPYNALSYSFFGYNLKNPFLADKKVRKAFTYAINRQEMLDSFFNGRGTIISGPFAPGSWAYNLDVKPLSYDPAKAKELLAEAGFKDTNGDGIIEKDGKPFVLMLKVPIEKESEAVKRVVLAFQNYLKNVGVNVNVEFREWHAWKEDVFAENSFDMIFASWVFDDSADISSLFHSGEIGRWKNNFGGYSNPDVDALIAESKLTLDFEKRRTINQKLHAILAEENPYTFLWTLTNYAAVQKKVRKVEIHPYKFFSFADDWFIPESEQK